MKNGGKTFVRGENVRFKAGAYGSRERSIRYKKEGEEGDGMFKSAATIGKKRRRCVHRQRSADPFIESGQGLVLGLIGSS